MIGIYQIWIGDNFYIGRSQNLSGRTSGHLRELKLGKHGNERMQRAYNKYQTFEWHPLVECAVEACAAWEQAYIDDNIQDSQCMNMNPHASGGWDFLKGKPGANKGKTMSIEQRHKISESLKGNIISEETRRKIGEGHKGKTHSEEWRRKLSESQTKRWAQKKLENA